MRKPHELILHIGHYKTGTTALQVFMTQNRRPMARAGLTYAKTVLEHAKHSTLAFTLLREAGVTALMYGFNNKLPARDHWRRLFDEARALPRRRALLVSSEEFMRLGAHPGAVDILRDIMAEAPDIHVRVIAYLRPPQAHLRSWYNQMIKLGHPVAGFDAALRTQFESIHRDYATALHPWIELFGENALILRGFDDRLRQGDTLYRDFLGALGYPMPGCSILPPEDPNPRLDDRLLPIRRALNNSDLPRQTTTRIMQQATRALAEHDGPQHGDSIASIREAAQTGIVWLSTLPGASFDAGNLLQDLPRAQDRHEQATDALASILTHEIAQLRQSQRRLQARMTALEKRLDGDTPEGT